MKNKIKISSNLLKWYDQHARELPWRIPPLKSKIGIKPDPYNVWLSEIMLQQTTVKAVISYYESFILKWPNIMQLASTPEEEIMEAWAGLGYYRRARNLIQCAKIVSSEYRGVFPKSERLLLKLPGIGSYTAAAIKSIAFDKKAVVVDGNIARIISRLFAIDTPVALSQNKINTLASDLIPDKRYGDYAQALMDLGSQICTPKNPQCERCPIIKCCKSYAKGLARLIPYRMKKKSKPTKYGYVFVTLVKNNNGLVLERRPNEGLLGGMLCFPSSLWKECSNIDFHPPFDANWTMLNESVTHVFSHFNLNLQIVSGSVQLAPSRYIISPLQNFNRESLPSLMRKVFDIGSKKIF